MTLSEVSASDSKPSTFGLVRIYFSVLLQYPGDSWRLAGLIGLMSAGAMLETTAIGLVLPFIRLLQDPKGFMHAAPLPEALRPQVQVAPLTSAGSILAVHHVCMAA